MGYMGSCVAFSFALLTQPFHPLTGLNVTGTHRLTEVSSVFREQQIERESLPRGDLTKRGRVLSILGGTKREQRREREEAQTRAPSHATLWPQASTCCLLMALFCVNMPPLFGRDVGVCPTMESIWGAHILPHMNVYIVLSSEASFLEAC